MSVWSLISEWEELEKRMNSLPLNYQIFIKQIAVLEKLVQAGTTTLPDGRDIQQLLNEYQSARNQVEQKFPHLKKDEPPPPPPRRSFVSSGMGTPTFPPHPLRQTVRNYPADSRHARVLTGSLYSQVYIEFNLI